MRAGEDLGRGPYFSSVMVREGDILGEKSGLTIPELGLFVGKAAHACHGTGSQCPFPTVVIRTAIALFRTDVASHCSHSHI